MGTGKRRSSRWPDAIARALLLIPQHPQVIRISDAVRGSEGDVEVDVSYRVNLPNQWRTAGRSPNGIGEEEIVRLRFPDTYPTDAPTPSLRPDFDRSLPHVMPYLEGDRPVPCVAEISLGSLLQQQGLRGILNQIALWLDNAALGTLIDSIQGWEPVRRDDLPHGITADAEGLRSKVTRDGGHLFLPFSYAVLELARGGKGIRGSIGPDPIIFRAGTLEKYVSVKSATRFSLGVSIALLVWPGKKSDGTLFVCDRYRPEDVQTFGDLLRRAREYGCERPLTEQLAWLRQCASGRTPHLEIPIAIVLCVRRPIHLIGSESDIELIGYAGTYRDILSTHWQDAIVEPAAHNQTISSALSRKLSGVNEPAGTWTLIGAGSIGSKLALHLTRQGMAPSHIIDSGIMRAHNAVRHGLMPRPEHMEALFTGHKAELLCEGIASFAQHSEPILRDAVTSLRVSAERRRIISRNTLALVNSAASIRVREAIAALSFQEMNASVIETSLFSDGQIGLVTIEGARRTPNTGDLISEFYRLAGTSMPLQRQIFGQHSELTRVSIGEGCGSATMVISDARISAYSAAMAQIISKHLQTPDSDRSGRVAIGTITDDEISLSWSQHEAPKIRVVRANNLPQWTIRISDRVEEAILADIGLWPSVETGGILMGRISEVSRSFYITDILPAPPDSQRSATLFSLGVPGIKATLKEYSERHGWSLYCLGTWHSHLGGSSPSKIDAHTARCVSLARIAPSLLLIKAPGGYSALVADAAATQLEYD